MFGIIVWLSFDDNFLWIKDISNNFGGIIATLFIIMYVSILPILSEYMIRRERRKYGLPIYKAVTPDMLAEAEVAREYRAKKNLGIGDEGSVDKMDIRYWHGLLKEGIIDQEEFDRKKMELV